MKNYHFDEHGIGYKKGRALQPFRPQFEVILGEIQDKSKVLDIGCGDGVLGEKLIKQKSCSVWGVDLDIVGVEEANRRGIKARVWDADLKLPFGDKSFDVVICTDLLQHTQNPNLLVSELFRVGKKVIISFPNFGFWAYRAQMAFGHFPQLALFGHKWWETRQLKFFSLGDFLNLPALKKKKEPKIICINWRNRRVSLIARISPNLFSRSCILIY